MQILIHKDRPNMTHSWNMHFTKIYKYLLKWWVLTVPWYKYKNLCGTCHESPPTSPQLIIVNIVCEDICKKKKIKYEIYKKLTLILWSSF